MYLYEKVKKYFSYKYVSDKKLIKCFQKKGSNKMKENFKELNELIRKEQEIQEKRKKLENDMLFHFAKDALGHYEIRIREHIKSNFRMYFIIAAYTKMQGMIKLYSEREDGSLKNYLWLICMEVFDAAYESLDDYEKYKNPNIPIDKEIFGYLFALDRKLLNLVFSENGKFNPSNVVSKGLKHAEDCLTFKMLVDMFQTLYVQYDIKRRVEVDM